MTQTKGSKLYSHANRSTDTPMLAFVLGLSLVAIAFALIGGAL